MDHAPVVVVVVVACVVAAIACALRRRYPPFSLDIGMPLVARDAPLLPAVLRAMNVAAADGDVRLHVVTMESDRDDLCATVARHSAVPLICSTVPDYTIDAGRRHSLVHVAAKRNVVRERARADARGAVLFLDSDVLLNADTIDRLQRACAAADVCAAAYHPAWSFEPVVAVGSAARPRLTSAYRLPPGDGGVPIVAAGMGCTLLRGDAALRIPFAVGRDPTTGVEGEDIGYMQRANDAGLRIRALPQYHVTHLAAARTFL